MDAGLYARLRAVEVDESVASSVDAVIVVGSSDGDLSMRGGTRSDIDRVRAAARAPAARQRSKMRPPISNTRIARQFGPPRLPKGDVHVSDVSRPLLVKMPQLGRSPSPEVALFWAGCQLLRECREYDERLRVAAERELRGACGAAYYARAAGVDETLIESSLEDVALMCAALLDRRGGRRAGAAAAVENDVALDAVRVLASGLPSSARLGIEGM